MKKTEIVSIIIPTYKERQNIIPLVKKIITVLSQNKTPHEIIVVDDNSRDGIEKAVSTNFNQHAGVKLFIRKKEKGLGTAILFGMQKAKGSIIIGMDADFNHPPELIPKLIKNLAGVDLIIASRFISGGGMEDKARYFFTYLFNLFLKFILGFPTMDNMSGFYAVKKQSLETLPLVKIYQGYGEYHLRLLYFAANGGLTITETPVFYKKRVFGKSKTNLVKYFFVYLWTALKLRLTKIA